MSSSDWDYNHMGTWHSLSLLGLERAEKNVDCINKLIMVICPGYWSRSPIGGSPSVCWSSREIPAIGWIRDYYEIFGELKTFSITIIGDNDCFSLYLNDTIAGALRKNIVGHRCNTLALYYQCGRSEFCLFRITRIMLNCAQRVVRCSSQCARIIPKLRVRFYFWKSRSTWNLLETAASLTVNKVLFFSDLVIAHPLFKHIFDLLCDTKQNSVSVLSQSTLLKENSCRFFSLTRASIDEWCVNFIYLLQNFRYKLLGSVSAIVRSHAPAFEWV